MLLAMLEMRIVAMMLLFLNIHLTENWPGMYRVKLLIHLWKTGLLELQFEASLKKSITERRPVVPAEEFPTDPVR